MNNVNLTNNGRRDTERLPTRFVSAERTSELMQVVELMPEDLVHVAGGAAPKPDESKG
ncbi:MAG: hypothetical protein JO227_12375 [Acetobacteraceae bacterium]|nr:hypothetical protein [Acetobacteraceae bacterium]